MESNDQNIQDQSFQNWLDENGLKVSDLSDSFYGLVFEIIDRDKFEGKTNEQMSNM